jgi:magnesium and cobalt transporter
MDDGTEGSSSAAQGALTDESDDRRGGFFGRIIGAFSPTDSGGPVPVNPRRAFYVANSGPVPGMVNLRQMRVEDVMIPKAEIVSVPVNISKNDLVEVFRQSGMSRVPVFSGTLDSPVGLVHLKDFALTHGFDGKGERYVLRKLLRPLLYAPPSMPIGVLLQKMQTERTHMALVIDEYGGVDGLVTIEDLIEQVIGEIEDEHDLEEGALWMNEAPGVYLAESRAPLDEFEAEIGMALRGEDADEDEVDTLGGLVFLLAGHVPARGEVIPHPGGAEFEIVDADPRRIKRLRVQLPKSAMHG